MGKLFFLVQTVDHAKHYSPENKIVIDIQAGIKILEDKVGILKHVEELTRELCRTWNDAYLDRPQVTSKAFFYEQRVDHEKEQTF